MADIPNPPFATVQDLESRWHKLLDSESEQATVLLADASQMVIDTCPQYVNASPLTLTSIVCAMVKRAMISGDSDAVGVSSTQETAGPFSQSMSYTNPMGDLYLTKAEKLRLGKGSQRAFSIDLGGGT